MDLEDPACTVKARQRTHVAKPNGRPGLEPDRLPDPDTGQLCAPVPAVTEGGFADRVERMTELMRAVTDFGRPPIRLDHRRRKGHLQLVVTGDEQLGDIEAVAAVLILGPSHFPTVEHDSGDGV